MRIPRGALASKKTATSAVAVAGIVSKTNSPIADEKERDEYPVGGEYHWPKNLMYDNDIAINAVHQSIVRMENLPF